MLKLVNIKKDYIMGDTKVEALKGIDLNFRKNEFVSILGPSGCGKTTLLNIIGGLDKYTDGDLVINGVSTKEFTDRDWDVYRNHRIGFIFQSYNLIPHQTILENVELALTIAGMEKNERVEKAKNALDKVGLKGQYNKKPNQLSGGQCQRVAIARALVNEPEILLADEPTGALDTTTSIQIMDLIKEISKEKLVIMVTHNPELAEKYSTRIVRLLDGEVSSDSMICSNEEEQKEKFANSATPEKAKMSFWTAFRLSARNLMSKLKRTLMVGFAGSIGIIGVSVVLALSSGITDYINSMQEDMLSGNPITITEQAYDINAMMNSMTRSEKKEILKESNYIYVDSILEKLAKRAEEMNSILVTNEINEDYVAYLKNMPSSYLESLAFDYGVDLSFSIYTDFTVNNKTRSTSIATIKNIYASLLEETEFKESSSAVSTLSQAFTQLLPNKEYLLSQYDLVDGKMATEKNEIMLVVDRNSEVSDLILAQLGYYTEEEFLNAAYKAFDKNNAKYNPALDKEKFSYQELKNKKFYWYPNNSIYTKNEGNNILKPASAYPFFYNPYMDNEYSSTSNAVELQVVGILCPKENVNYGSLTSGFFYTEALTNHILAVNKNSQIAEELRKIDGNKFTSIYTVNYDSETGTSTPGIKAGIVYEYDYYFNGDKKGIGLVGSTSLQSRFASMMGSIMGGGSGSSSSTTMCTLSLNEVGGSNIPTGISIYPVDFDTKDLVVKYLDAWNNEETIVVNGKTLTKADRSTITYTDNLSLVISMINTLITVVTTSLIVFTAISLVVSTVMIGIITYVSVVERTKEIGVIRSLGGRKKDVGHLFNAETFIIGAVAGIIGIIITLILEIIGNLIIGHFTGIYSLVSLKWYHAIIMISLSIFLTLFSGLIPSRAAAKMDPVNALRSE